MHSRKNKSIFIRLLLLCLCLFVHAGVLLWQRQTFGIIVEITNAITIRFSIGQCCIDSTGLPALIGSNEATMRTHYLTYHHTNKISFFVDVLEDVYQSMDKQIVRFQLHLAMHIFFLKIIFLTASTQSTCIWNHLHSENTFMHK